jgi:hypothetical protein
VLCQKLCVCSEMSPLEEEFPCYSRLRLILFWRASRPRASATSDLISGFLLLRWVLFQCQLSIADVSSFVRIDALTASHPCLLPIPEASGSYPGSQIARISECHWYTVSHATNSVGVSTAREATSCAATRLFPSILWNPKVHYLYLS